MVVATAQSTIEGPDGGPSS